MNRRVKYVLPVTFVLLVLTEVVVLHWSLEAIFFVTWLLLALLIQHDSRLSAVIGLIILVACPFLLVSNKQPVAEQAANYAYFFLAIGVSVQIEELLLERLGWLGRKLDFSYLWRPGSYALCQGWHSAVHVLGQLMKQAHQKQSGMYPGARSQRSAWLIRGGVALVVLLLAIVAIVWLFNLLNANQLAQMKVSYDFIDHLAEVIHPIPPGEGETTVEQNWTVDQVTERVLNQSPAFVGSSRILYQVNVPDRSKLAFDVAMNPESWGLEGDGVAFMVFTVADGNTHQVFSTYIDPKHNIADRRWYPYTIDLSDYSGKLVTFIFETNVGPMGDFRYDWAGWGNPRLLVP